MASITLHIIGRAQKDKDKGREKCEGWRDMVVKDLPLGACRKLLKLCGTDKRGIGGKQKKERKNERSIKSLFRPNSKKEEKRMLQMKDAPSVPPQTVLPPCWSISSYNPPKTPMGPFQMTVRQRPMASWEGFAAVN
jgi:hypothetical protein